MEKMERMDKKGRRTEMTVLKLKMEEDDRAMKLSVFGEGREIKRTEGDNGGGGPVGDVND
jgi:hypothetical protein